MRLDDLGFEVGPPGPRPRRIEARRERERQHTDMD
jgi:hypothetical protein